MGSRGCEEQTGKKCVSVFFTAKRSSENRLKRKKRVRHSEPALSLGKNNVSECVDIQENDLVKMNKADGREDGSIRQTSVRQKAELFHSRSYSNPNYDLDAQVATLPHVNRFVL